MRLTWAVMLTLGLAGCAVVNSSSGAARPEPQHICGLVDATQVTALLAGAGSPGGGIERTGTVGSVRLEQHECVFPAGAGELVIGVAALDGVTAGPEQAMRVYLGSDSYPENDTVAGIGQLATITTSGDTASGGITQLVAVDGSGSRWNGITVVVTGPSIDRAQLTELARQCLGRI